ncbi:alkane hydroxylase MAH1-like [Mangifera indica]|uniref:alkane hydroxylase MAH1-like n=1 Tax=Mangifera indica TaxID=29780 RepID=UPI001CFC0B10|nr:alkane hydroxylase MAH1-like [Mangifera indica]
MMAPLLAYLQYTILAISFVLLLHHYTKKKKFLWNLPLVGMLPEFLFNIDQIHEKTTQILEQNKGTFLVKGAWLGQMDTLVTCDPAIVNCVMKENFSSYHKGVEWRKRFEFFGNHSMFNTDFDEWKLHRNTFRTFISHQQSQQTVEKTIGRILDNGLIPVLEHASKQCEVIDLQELSQRYTFDFASSMATGRNPNSLCIGLPKNPVPQALDSAWEAIILRFLLPERLWKLAKWSGFGKERKMSEGREAVDRFCTEQISINKMKLREGKTKTSFENEKGFNFLNLYLTGNEENSPKASDEVMRDNMLNLIFATGETTSTALTWFFWMLEKNPFVEKKIREEIRTNLPLKADGKNRIFQLEELNKLIYLHAALCEALRLFPPAHIQIRTPLKSETLPGGHRVDDKVNILIFAYGMARMPSVWGDDCREYKPERWITEDGGIKHEPPHKFFSFNAGPRICLGKEIAFNLMKAIAATFIHNYTFQVLENHRVTPALSVMFRMKFGLLAKINKIWA